MAPPLEERRLSDLSEIQVRYFVGPSYRVEHYRILVIRYSGTYPIGSAGNSDAIFMCAMAQAGVTAFEPDGVIHDLSELDYQWGDMLDAVFTIGPDQPLPTGEDADEDAGDRSAIVVGPGCEEAVRTLILGVNSREPLEAVGWAFRDLASGWMYVESQFGSR